MPALSTQFCSWLPSRDTQRQTPATTHQVLVPWLSLPAAGGLVRLDLHDNPITSEFAADLAAVVARQPRLQALVLNDTSLGDEGISTVCAALAQPGAAPQLEVGGRAGESGAGDCVE